MTVQLLREKTVTARKPHPCKTCGQHAVQPGERYHRSTLVYDGRVYDWVQCLPCREMSSEIWDWAGHPDDGVGQDEYIEWAEEHSTHGTPEQQAIAHRYIERLAHREDPTR